GGSGVAAPRPLGKVRADSCSHRVHDDVATEGEQVRFALDEDRAIARLEDVAAAVMPYVEPLCIAPVQLPHAARQVWQRCLDHEVVVVVHEAVRVAEPREALDDMSEEAEEVLPIDGVANNVAAGVPA